MSQGGVPTAAPFHSWERHHSRPTCRDCHVFQPPGANGSTTNPKKLKNVQIERELGGRGQRGGEDAGC